ncbi:MAG: DUF1080 domain-containing protein [Bacteroidota bacterium]
MTYPIKITLIVFTLLFFAEMTIAQKDSPIIGCWDLEITFEGKKMPSWLEVRKSGYKTLIGRFVYAFGSARPIAHVQEKNGTYSFAIPPQWEQGERDMEFEFKLVGQMLKGKMIYTNGTSHDWVGTRAPLLKRTDTPIWGAPQALFNGKDLTGWRAMGKNQWTVENGILTSKMSGSNLVTQKEFTDFKLHIEFRYPEGSNSGVYLRGRYEVQIADNAGLEPSDVLFGGVYGFLTPNQMVAKPAGEWQAFDITLIGRRVTVVANGVTIINDQIIPGITGGALDSNEGEAGPFFLQGDHGPIEYRNIVVTPVMKR